MCIVGEIEELGAWKKFTGQMKWTEGHIWELENLYVSSKSFFNYKYVLMKDEKPHTWETGCNRIADLRLLPEVSGQNDVVMQNINLFQNKNAREMQNSKRVELNDVW